MFEMIGKDESEAELQAVAAAAVASGVEEAGVEASGIACAGVDGDERTLRFIELGQRYFATVEQEAPNTLGLHGGFWDYGAQIAFSYEPDIEDITERGAHTDKEIDWLNWAMMMQSVMPLPLYFASLVALETFLILGAKGMPMPLVLFLMFCSAIATVLIGIAIIAVQLKKFDFRAPIVSTVLPDQIIAASNGLIFRWLGTLSYSSWPLRWSEMALVYTERTKSGDTQLCIRDKRGGVLRLRESHFGTPAEFAALKEIISRRASLAARQRSSALLAQPEQRFKFVYVFLWLMELLCRKSEGKAAIVEGTSLKNGKYKIVQRLGRDAYSTLYLADIVGDVNVSNCTLIGKGDDGGQLAVPRVIIREFSIPEIRNPLKLIRLLEQLEESSRGRTSVSGRGIAYWLEHFVEGRKLFVVLERVEGESIYDHVARSGALSEMRAVELGIELAEVVGSMHYRPVFSISTGRPEITPLVHGRLEPRILIIDEQKRLRIRECTQLANVFKGKNETVFGDKRYLAPEQLSGQPTVQSDIYAIGKCLQYMVTGKQPEPLSQACPRQVNGKLSSKIDAIVKKATAVNVWERYSDVEELIADLRDLRGEEHC